MKKRKRLLAVSFLMLLLMAAIAVLFWPRGPKEPVYEGKRLDFWLKPAVFGSREEDMDQAERAVKAIGTNALPYLLHQLTRPEPRSVTFFNKGARALGLSAFVRGKEEERVTIAAWGLYYLGADAAPALPELAKHWGDPLRGTVTAGVMGKCGDTALPFFRTALASTNLDVVRTAANGLENAVREGTEAALPLLLGLLNHASDKVRWNAASELGQVKSRPDLVVPALTRVLSDPASGVQFHAASSLELKREAARPALPELRRLMTNSNPRVAWAASNAVFRIDPAALAPPRP